MSQQELAARAGLRREKVNRLESKGEDVSLEELARLLDAVGMELAVRRKGQAPHLDLSSSLSEAKRDLVPQSFEKAAFVDGSKVRIVSWGKLPK